MRAYVSSTPPVGTDRVAVFSRRLAKQRKEALHPAIDGALIDQDAALGQPLADLGVAQPVAHIRAHGQGDDVVWEAAARERRTRALHVTPTAVATAEQRAAELGGPIVGHNH